MILLNGKKQIVIYKICLCVSACLVIILRVLSRAIQATCNEGLVLVLIDLLCIIFMITTWIASILLYHKRKSLQRDTEDDCTEDGYKTD